MNNNVLSKQEMNSLLSKVLGRKSEDKSDFMPTQDTGDCVLLLNDLVKRGLFINIASDGKNWNTAIMSQHDRRVIGLGVSEDFCMSVCISVIDSKIGEV